MVLTDIHTHILPEIDDGAASVDLSHEMLRKLKDQHVTRVVLTPHFYPFKQALEDFEKEREQSFKKFSACSLPENLELLTAAEVHLAESLFNYDDLSSLKIPGTDFILIELPYAFKASSYEVKLILKLCYNYNLKPILAHVERYPALIGNKSLMMDLIEEGCKMQLSADALKTAGYFQKKKLVYYLKNNMIHCTGTDCHNLSTRPPQYRKFIADFEKILGAEETQALLQAQSIFGAN